MTTSVTNSFLPTTLISNLQQVLVSRNDAAEEESQSSNRKCRSSNAKANAEKESEKPVVLVTNGEGMESHGLTLLVEALARDRHFNVHVCAPQSDKSVSGHSVMVRETFAVSSVEMSGDGVTAYEVSGTPADCVSLALSGALFSWSKPVLVISGINVGSSCGHKMKKDVSCETDLKDAVNVCLPLIYTAVKDIESGIYPKSCLLNVDIPSCPSANKGLKGTRQSMLRSSLSWQAVLANRHPSAGHLSNQQSLGIKLAQLSRDASAAGAARRLNLQRKNAEIESVGVVGKLNTDQRIKKYFGLEFLEKDPETVDDELDFRAIEDGFFAVTPFSLSPAVQSEIQTLVSEWIAAANGRMH